MLLAINTIYDVLWLFMVDTALLVFLIFVVSLAGETGKFLIQMSSVVCYSYELFFLQGANVMAREHTQSCEEIFPK